MKDFKGKVAFITGGASGIGLGIAKVCAKYGMKVIIVDMRQEALDEAIAYFKKNNLPAHAIKLDVTDRAAYVKAADEAEKVFGKIHLLVNNAGVGSGGGAIEKLTYKDWDYSMGVNIGGVINGCMTIIPRIIKHGEGGHIVSTSSTCGIIGARNFSIYCTTKFAVAGLMESLAGELESKGIGASVLIPGAVATNLGQTSFANRPAHLRTEGEAPPPPPPPPKAGEPQKPNFMTVAMDPVETGERVIRGIINNDIFIITHPEFKAGFEARNKALMRAIPDEPRNDTRLAVLKDLGDIFYNPVYDRQEQVGPPNWE